MKTIIFVFLIITSFFALIVIIRGDWLINLIPIVKRFRRAHQEWGQIKINNAAIHPSLSLNELGQWRFEEINDNNSNKDISVLDQIRHKRLGDILTVVSYKEKHLRQLLRELRMYSAVFLILLVTGAITNANQFTDKSFSEIVEVVFSYHVIPVLELIMILYLLIRLTVETQSIASLLEGE